MPSTRRRASLLPTMRGEPLSQSSFLPRWALADTESSASKDAPRLTTGASPTQHVCVAIFYSFRLSTALSTLAHQSRAGLNREVLQLSEPCPLASLPGSNTFFLTLILDRFVFVYTPRSELRGMPRSRFLVVPLLGYPTSTSRYGWVSHERVRSGSTGPKSQSASGRIDAHPRTTLQVRALRGRRLKPRAGRASRDRSHATGRDRAPRQPSARPRPESISQPATALRNMPPRLPGCPR